MNESTFNGIKIVTKLFAFLGTTKLINNVFNKNYPKQTGLAKKLTRGAAMAAVSGLATEMATTYIDQEFEKAKPMFMDFNGYVESIFSKYDLEEEESTDGDA